MTDIDAWRRLEREPTPTNLASLSDETAVLRDILLAQGLRVSGVVPDSWSDVFEARGALPFQLHDVDVPLAAAVETGDWAEVEVWAVVRLLDGRWGYIEGGCDTTGWDCQSSASGAAADTLTGLLPLITDEGTFRLFGCHRAPPSPR